MLAYQCFVNLHDCWGFHFIRCYFRGMPWLTHASEENCSGDHLPIFQVSSGRWEYRVQWGDYVPLLYSYDLLPSYFSFAPGFMLDMPPFQPKLLIRAGTHGNLEDVLLEGALLGTFMAAFGGPNNPPNDQLAAILRDRF